MTWQRTHLLAKQRKRMSDLRRACSGMSPTPRYLIYVGYKYNWFAPAYMPDCEVSSYKLTTEKTDFKFSSVAGFKALIWLLCAKLHCTCMHNWIYGLSCPSWLNWPAQNYILEGKEWSAKHTPSNICNDIFAKKVCLLLQMHHYQGTEALCPENDARPGYYLCHWNLQ